LIGLLKIIKIDNISDWINVYFISDVHLGNTGANIQALKNTIQQIKDDKRGRWIGTGDIFDAITWKDKRYDPDVHTNDYADNIVKDGFRLLEPIADKCLALGDGNHEDKYRTMNGISLMGMLADRLKTTYYGYSCLMRILVNDHSVVYFIHHGYGGGRNQGAQIKKCEDAMKLAFAHFYVISHVHFKPVGDLITREITTHGQLRDIPHKFLVTGAYQDNLAGYADKQMYPQASHGSPITQFRWFGKNHDLQLRVIS
jgi:UDP-2,3-diacylglucosamine pyrophosphatase LpxH